MGATAGNSAVPQLRRSRMLLQAYILCLPLWWAIGIDFIVPMLLVTVLMAVSAAAHRQFALSDYLLLSIIVVLGMAAFVKGFVVGHHTIRLLAAMYNLSIWVCGLLILQQTRHLLVHDRDAPRAILRTLFFSFLTYLSVAWGAIAFAYVVRDFNLELPTLFGITMGHAVPDSAALIKESTIMLFTRPDWGLPGVPMPRIVVLGPYPTATAAIAAVLGSLALLHLHQAARINALAVLLVEAAIVLTLAITLTRSVIGGWLIGMVVANLVFGTMWRRLAASVAVVAALLASLHVDLSATTEYRGYSTQSRFENYDRAVARTFDHSPVLGLGVKPREADNHIAVGSHSTFVSSFTKAGALGLSLVTAYLVIVPALRWFTAFTAFDRSRRSRAELRILFNLQVSVWIWICFEDLDAPVTAAMMIFIFFAFTEVALMRRPSSMIRPSTAAVQRA